jgi:hypothetical protein
MKKYIPNTLAPAYARAFPLTKRRILDARFLTFVKSLVYDTTHMNIIEFSCRVPDMGQYIFQKIPSVLRVTRSVFLFLAIGIFLTGCNEDQEKKVSKDVKTQIISGNVVPANKDVPVEKITNVNSGVPNDSVRLNGPSVIPPKLATISVAAGARHSLYITTEGKLYAMGWNKFGQLGDGTAGDKAFKATPVLIAEKVASVAAGAAHSLYITTDGKL